MLKGTSSFCIFYLSWDLRRCLEWDQHRKSFLAEHINVLKAIGGIKTKAFQSESPLNRMGSSTACFEYFQPVSRKPVGWTGSGNSRTFWRSWRRCSFWSNLRATGTWLVHGRIFSFPYVFFWRFIYHIYLAMFMWTPLWAFPSARGVPGLHWDASFPQHCCQQRWQWCVQQSGILQLAVFHVRKCESGFRGQIFGNTPKSLIWNVCSAQCKLRFATGRNAAAWHARLPAVKYLNAKGMCFGSNDF